MKGKINEQIRELTIDEIDAVSGGTFTQVIRQVLNALQSPQLSPQGLSGDSLGGTAPSLGI
jgi:hypothetical protein